MGSHSHHHSHFSFARLSEDKNHLKRLAAYASVGVSFLLIGAKTYACYSTHSISLLSSLADSVLDFAASVINMVAIHLAVKPADEEHKFGHGKIEALAALFQSIIIILSAAFVLKEAVHRFFNPEALEKPLIGVFVTLFSIVLTLFLVRFQRYVINKTKSMAIMADSTHYKADLYLNLGVLLSIGTYFFLKWTYIDIIFGTGIALYIMFTTYHIIRSALNVLLDNELPLPDRHNILEIIQSHPEVEKCCHLKTRSSGQEEFIQGHLVMHKNITVEKAYHIANDIKKQVLSTYPQAQCVFQIQPHNHEKDQNDVCCES